MSNPDLAEFARGVDQFLLGYLKKAESELARIDPAAPAALSPVTRMIQSGGKRLRPYLCMLGYQAARGNNSDAILKVAASVELFHAFALLHDDIIDGSVVRRGLPSASAPPAKTNGTRTEGLATALLAGDLSFALSDALFWESGFPAEDLARATLRINHMRLETAAGQMMELAFDPSDATLRNPSFSTKVALLKTASYSTTGPLLIGATLARGADELLLRLQTIGNAAGEALQLSDDLDELETEDRAGFIDDLRNGRPSRILLEAAGDERVWAQVSSLWGNADLKSEDAARVAELLKTSPAPGRVALRIKELIDSAAAHAQSIPGEAGSKLREFAVSLLPGG